MRRKRRFKRRNLLNGLLFTSPWLIGLALFIVYPLGVSFYYSMTDYNILSAANWSGLDNLKQAASDTVLRISVGNTLLYSVAVIPINLAVGLLLALLINRAKGGKVFSLLIYAPSTLPLVVVGMVFGWMYNGKFGIINWLLGALGISGPSWLTTTMWVKPAIGLANLFLIGPMVLINLSALRSVPTELLDASRIDGCNYARRVWNIELPMISPVILFNAIMQIIGTVQIFDLPYTLTSGNATFTQPGGPNNASLFYIMYLTRMAFQQFRMGYASLLGWLLFIFIFICVGGALLFGRKRIYYAAE
jgi:multiple sugar transport system permease protein